MSERNEFGLVQIGMNGDTEKGRGCECQGIERKKSIDEKTKAACVRDACASC